MRIRLSANYQTLIYGRDVGSTTSGVPLTPAALSEVMEGCDEILQLSKDKTKVRCDPAYESSIDGLP